MIDYLTLKLIWWCLIGFVLIVFACTAGFDFGGTLFMPFLKKEKHKKVALNILAPTWDGNMTWFVFAGGSLFIVWPVVYGLVFSGIYSVMFCLLFSNFLRPPGFDYRSKIDSDIWRKFWDRALFVSSIIPMFMFGFIFGNLLMGLPFHFDNIFLRDFYTGNFWGLLNWCGIFCGLCSFCVLAQHGASYLALRTESELHDFFRRMQFIFGILFVIFFTATGFIVTYHVKGYVLDFSPIYATGHPLDNIVHMKAGAWIESYQNYWWKIFGPVIAYLGVIICLIASLSRYSLLSFIGSILSVSGAVLTAGFSLFPFIVPSSTNPNQSLTVYNSTSNAFALYIILFITLILLVPILAYKIWAYKTIWGKKRILTADDIDKDPHAFY